jgi:hypothetical protein
MTFITLIKPSLYHPLPHPQREGRKDGEGDEESKGEGFSWMEEESPLPR